MLSSYPKFKQKHSAFGASHFRTVLFGNTASELLWEELQVDDPVFLAPGAKLGTETLRHKGAQPGRWSEDTLHLPQGQGSLCLLEEGGCAPEGCQGPAWAGRGDGAAPGLIQRHLPLPSRSPALVCL